jgi:hypothetical protein
MGILGGRRASSRADGLLRPRSIGVRERFSFLLQNGGGGFIPRERVAIRFVENRTQWEEHNGQENNHGFGTKRMAIRAAQCICSRKRRHRQYIDWCWSADRSSWSWNTKQRQNNAAGSRNQSCYDQHQSQSFTEKFYSANKCTPVSKEYKRLSELIPPA